MKRLAIFLCGMLLLASCNDIDDARMLPTEFSIDDIIDVSEISYDELESLMLMIPDYQKEEMRMNGGMLIKASVKMDEYHKYDNAYLWYSTEMDGLPENFSNGWNSNNLNNISYDKTTPVFYQSYLQEGNPYLQFTTFYYKMSIESWGEEYPGFVDDCLMGTDYYSRYVFSGVKAYTLPEVPLIYSCRINGDNSIYADFDINFRYGVTRYGLCYSLKNALPTIDDSMAVQEIDPGNMDNKYTNVHLWTEPEESGIYYVRAFAESKNGIGYSPVHKVVFTKETR